MIFFLNSDNDQIILERSLHKIIHQKYCFFWLVTFCQQDLYGKLDAMHRSFTQKPCISIYKWKDEKDI